jgi:hypothetical protein
MNRRTGFEIRTRLQRLGIYRDSGHEHLAGSLVIPILGEGRADGPGELMDRQVLGIYGRKIRDDLRPGTPLHLYLPGPHRGVFNVEALKASKEVILCEALIDALTFWCAGFRNVTAAYGVEGFTHDHLAAFKAYGTEHVLIAYDRDDAGNHAAETLAKRLIPEGIACSRVLFPKGMDVNDYALNVQPAPKSLGVLLRSAEWIGGPTRAPRAGALAPAPAPAPASAPAREVTASSAAMSTRAAKEDVAERVVSASQPETVAAKEEKVSGLAPAALEGDDEALFRFDDRSYRVKGLKKALQSGALHVTVRAQRDGDLFAPPSPIAGWFLDRFDFISSRQRALFEKQAAHEMGVRPEVVKWDLGQVLRRLEELQHEALTEALKPKTVAPAMTDEERADALEMLSAEDLVERILRDFTRCGVVGEATNKLVGYLAAISRKLDRPLAVIVRSSSAAGKSALMEAVLSFVPKEEREKYSALSANSLFYFDKKDFKHKVLAIVEEEGAQRASYALKLLQSEGEITIASTGKDPGTGRLVTKEYRVEGPVMIFLTSTAVEIDDELLNRAVVLTVDEGREQTRAIHRLQREAETLEGILAREERDEILTRHHHAQRLLQPVEVVNPYARALTFMDDRTRTRRDHTKYLTLIRSIALLFQYQRERKTRTSRRGQPVEYIEVALSDVALANRLAGEVLGRSLDELPPQTRRLLVLVDEMVKEAVERHGIDAADFRFSRRDVRERTGWGDTQLKIHLSRLVDLEYLLVHRGGRGQSFVYELLYHGEGQDGSKFLPGLIDIDSLARIGGLDVETLTQKTGDEAPEAEKHDYDADRSGFEESRSGVGRPPVGPWSGGGRGGVTPLPTAPGAGLHAIALKAAETPETGSAIRTYAQASRTDTGGSDGARLRMRRLTRGF